MSAGMRRVFKSSLVYIGDYRCRLGDCSCGGDECSTSTDLAFIRRGVFVKHRGSKKSLANPNHIVFFNRGEEYRVSHPIRGGDECTVFALSPDVLRTMLVTHEPQVADVDHPTFSLANAVCDSRLHLEHLQLLCSIETGGLDPLQVEESSINFVYRAISSAYANNSEPSRPNRPATRRAHEELAEDVKQAISARFNESLSLDDLATQTCSSPFHMCRIFRQQAGMSIHAYQTQLRLRAACERLQDDHKQDLTTLALDLGFNDHAHFSNAFRRAYGTPPSRLNFAPQN